MTAGPPTVDDDHPGRTAIERAALGDERADTPTGEILYYAEA